MALLSNSHLASVPGLGSFAPIIRRDLMPLLVIFEKFEPGAGLSLLLISGMGVRGAGLRPESAAKKGGSWRRLAARNHLAEAIAKQWQPQAGVRNRR